MKFKNLMQLVLAAVDTVLKAHPEYLTTEGARGQCVIASDNLLFTLDEMCNEIVDGYMAGNDLPHHWAVIGNICVDLTYRQFDKNAPCPKIWLLNQQEATP